MRAGIRASLLAAMIGSVLIEAGPIAVSHETQGTFNVTRMLAAQDEPWVMRVRLPFNESIVEGNMNADVHQPTLDKMSLQQAQRPLLLVGCEDGTAFVADGNNRLRWLITHGYKEARAHFFPFAYREQFRVRILKDGVELPANELLDLMMGKHSERARTI